VVGAREVVARVVGERPAVIVFDDLHWADSEAADGSTNSEVAERLYISPRTAGVHVSNILAKLGMSSRTEVAAWAIRAGLETS
jgi:hypothetical protein